MKKDYKIYGYNYSILDALDVLKYISIDESNLSRINKDHLQKIVNGLQLTIEILKKKENANDNI